MLTWIFIFLGISIVSGIFGFTGISATFGGLAKILFYLFLLAFIISLVAFLL